MLNLGLVRMSLKSAYEHHDVNARMCQICNCAQQRSIQIVQLWATYVLWLSTAQLVVDYRSEPMHVLRLIQCDIQENSVLRVTGPAICELIPLDLKLPKCIVEVTNNAFGLIGSAGRPNVVHVLG